MCHLVIDQDFKKDVLHLNSLETKYVYNYSGNASPNRILHRTSLFNYDIDLRVWAVEIWDLWLF